MLATRPTAFQKVEDVLRVHDRREGLTPEATGREWVVRPLDRLALVGAG